MNSIEINPWIQALGWTLLHSLWQGLILYLLVRMVVRIFPKKSPSFNYAVGAGSLLLFLLGSAATYYYLYKPISPAVPVQSEGLNFHWTTFVPEIIRDSPLQLAGHWIDQHLDQIVGAWLIGALVFSLRLLTAWWYSLGLQNGAGPIGDFWENKFRSLARHLGINRAVLLLQSSAVDSPILLGFLRPVILLPIGMLSGLSVEQVETILLHELAHIQRHDYIVNFIQSIAEVIFFFNPFVWALSAQLRVEREQCCDDIVVKLRSPLAYAQALHQLESDRIWNPSVALGATGEKNQLLQRIKRIMKTAEKKKETRGKMFSAALVILLLIGVSLLSVQAYQPRLKRKMDPQTLITSDTSKKDSDQKKEATYSRKSITTYDEKGEPHEKVTEDFEGDEELRPFLVVPDMDLDRVISAVPPIPEMEEMSEFAPLVPFPSDSLGEQHFNFYFQDTIPGTQFQWKRNHDLEDFGQQFTDRFREKFGDFYQKNKPEFDKMMKDLDKELENVQEQVNRLHDFDVDVRIEKDVERAQQELLRVVPRREEAMRTQEEAMRELERHMGTFEEELASKMANQAYHLKSSETRMVKFEKQLTDQLIKDGYLGKNETIKTMKWNDESIEVNGKKIKDQDKAKYNELHKKYLRSGKVGHVE